MAEEAWNHNIHYHDAVLGAIPPNCRRALDVGCGRGLLARKLAARCGEVIGIDSYRESVVAAGAAIDAGSRVTFVEGDVMTYPFSGSTFDLITAVATLHHLPLAPALERFRDLLNPGGVLAVIGLYRARTAADYAWSAVALPTSLILRRRYGYADVGAPLHAPEQTLGALRTAPR